MPQQANTTTLEPWISARTAYWTVQGQQGKSWKLDALLFPNWRGCLQSKLYPKSIRRSCILQLGPYSHFGGGMFLFLHIFPRRFQTPFLKLSYGWMSMLWALLSCSVAYICFRLASISLWIMGSTVVVDCLLTSLRFTGMARLWWPSSHSTTAAERDQANGRWWV